MFVDRRCLMRRKAHVVLQQCPFPQETPFARVRRHVLRLPIGMGHESKCTTSASEVEKKAPATLKRKQKRFPPTWDYSHFHLLDFFGALKQIYKTSNS